MVIIGCGIRNLCKGLAGDMRQGRTTIRAGQEGIQDIIRYEQSTG